MFFPRYIF